MTYDEFNEQYHFEDRAGFHLSTLQKEDALTFLGWGRSLNRYEVGGGKTVVSTVVSLMSGTTTTLILVPPILLLQWQIWLKQVSERVLKYQGTPPDRAKMTFAGHRWVLMSHTIFRKDFDRVLGDFVGVDLDIIVDEAQCLKNPASQIYKKVSTIASKRRLQKLTGTPTSKPLDCYSYIRLDSPQIYRSYAAFEAAHVAERDFFKAVVAYQNLEALAANFALRSIKRTKEELHGYNNTPLYPDGSYELSPEHMKLYEKLVEEQLLIFDDGSKIDATTATRMYHALQQIIVNFDFFSGDPTKKSAAYDLIDSVIEQTDCLVEGKSKLIIWTYYKLTSRGVLKYLKDKGIYAVGAFSGVDSQKSFDLFMKNPACRVGVFQYQSAGAGLNPQSVCWESLHIETSTTPMLTRQAAGRLDRIGQMHKPTMRFAVADGTIQRMLLENLMKNDDLVSRVERTKISLRAALLGGKI